MRCAKSPPPAGAFSIKSRADETREAFAPGTPSEGQTGQVFAGALAPLYSEQ